MKILLVTPLYPPDIAGSAPYVKELAKRLSRECTVTVLAYGHIPEAVEGVRLRSVEKSVSLPARLVRFARALREELRDTDAVLVENGPSVELPLFLAHFGHRKKIVFHLYDETALGHAAASRWYRILLRLGMLSAGRVLTHRNESVHTARITGKDSGKEVDAERPAQRPEILPFSPFPKEALSAYETSWERHVGELAQIFTTL